MLNRQEIMSKLELHRERLRAMGVASLALFGSVARGDNCEDSDVDLLVEFSRSVGIFDFLRVQQALEEILGVRKVDLVMPEALEEEIKEQVLKEAVHAA